jgi:glycerol-3-phosphate dehydrogenase (NAD(P)+)
MTVTFNHFGIIGAGAWGTALAITLAKAGRQVTLWAHEPNVVTAINQTHENAVYLKSVKLDDKIKAISNLADLATCDAWILATPAQHTREVVKQVAAVAGPIKPIIIATKGIEQGTTALMSDVIGSILPNYPIAILSGPTFAIEVAKGLPTALTLAIKDKVIGENLIRAMSTPSFRLYLTNDVLAAQLGGAIKNVLAVACGIISGRQMGENARAALMTRGLTEMIRLGKVLGGRPETLMGLSGLGDLVLTCSSAQSRNMSLGIALGQGRSLKDIVAERTSVSEGIYTASAALALAKKHTVEMPIVEAVDAVLNGADLESTIAKLLARPLKEE